MPGIVQTSKPCKAPPVVGPRTTKARRPIVDIPEFMINEARSTSVDKWDPSKHMAFKAPAAIYTMKEIGLEGQGISPHAVSEPFPLFTREAIMQMRREIFSDPVMKNCRFGSDFIANMVRGMGAERAPFIYDAWYDPAILAAISAVAGVDLIPTFDYEVANVNISINDEKAEVLTGSDEESAVAWHYDSFPFVCVTMASDCTGMVGGETAIKLPDGSEKKVRGPAMGTAVVMQGRYINHRAMKAFGGRERIALVTAFRPRNPLVRDETILTGVRPISHLEELYSQYVAYRFDVLEERFRHKLKEERRRVVMKRSINIGDLRSFIEDQQNYLASMLEELYEVE
ncbi:uncharacterized protein JN550_010090 [Neoarthrinium moseri]|uniref:uncharacterized protein n=1 Tax=Neoarthrinium moseri TaxID=1658444 RepID=UPI001FDC7BB7|nr:uncharacterized protein JN550_010090 [Neoarthrinium moseri]KAI1862753.1 hypothetical protein JN550_010090 [Neoarthrinium moseri]